MADSMVSATPSPQPMKITVHEPLATPKQQRASKQSCLRRHRRALLVAGLLLMLLGTAAIVYTFFINRSPSSSSPSSSSSSTPTAGNAGNNPIKPGVLTAVKRRPAIVVLGDSTTQYGGSSQGWEVLLHENYVRFADTFNRGLTGYNTRIYLEAAMPGILEEVTNYYNASAIIIWFGVNDATLVEGANAPQHVPIADYAQNLKTMIQQLRDATPHTRILLLSPTYVDEKQRLASMLAWGKNKTASLDRNNAETAKYARACGELYNSTFKNDQNVGYIDMFDHFNRTYPTDENKTNILRDGLHFSAVGDRIFFELVRWKIEQMVPAGELANYQFPPDSKYIHYDD